MDSINGAYYGYLFDASGYGQATRAYIHALHRAGVELSAVNLGNHVPQVRDQLVESLVGRKIEPDLHLFHGIPSQWAGHAFKLPNAVGMTVWETDTMPSQWRNALNNVLDVWLPCDFNVSAFERSIRSPLFKLPHPFPDGAAEEDATMLGEISPDDFIFYSIFEWQDRKCPEGLIRAFLAAFPEEGDAHLVIKTNPGAATVALQTVESIRRTIASAARVTVRGEGWSDAQINALHARGDCYVSLHRGEGWGYPLFEAVGRGTPVIATGYSGPMEYLRPDAHHLVGFSLAPVRQRYVYYDPRMRWADPDLDDAVRMMRCVHRDRDGARSRARAAAEAIRREYSLESVGAMARERLLDLLARTQPGRWKRLQLARRAEELPAGAPIPAAWYDQGYFEQGTKSRGWSSGYSWQVLGNLFQEMAEFLTTAFPEARSFLDLGCAKGFLGRALIERGREWHGVDHSAWAVDHAEESARPFILRECVEQVEFDRRFDLLIAFELLEQLTEAQARRFLERARAWTGTAIIATIPSFETEEEAERYDRMETDLSHITIRTYSWWDQLFRSAGWKQDPLHRVAQEFCRRHPLPQRMGWKLYLYAP